MGNLYISCKTSFDGMVDGCTSCSDKGFKPVTMIDSNLSSTLGISGAWFVGGSRNLFNTYEDENFTGIEVYNCCGSFVLAVKK